MTCKVCNAEEESRLDDAAQTLCFPTSVRHGTLSSVGGRQRQHACDFLVLERLGLIQALSVLLKLEPSFLGVPLMLFEMLLLLIQTLLKPQMLSLSVVLTSAQADWVAFVAALDASFLNASLVYS